MFTTTLLAVTVLLTSCSFVRGLDLSQQYIFNASLSGDDYVLYWNTKLQSKKIEFAVNVSTTGWVGFGLSPNGQMPNSDVVIGWIDSNGEARFYDCFASRRGLPSVDARQNWFLTRGLEMDGRTILEFYRSFDTCDEKDDMEIKADTARVIWSFNSKDPSSFSELAALIHESMGSSSLNLLGGLSEERVENNSDSIKIINNNVSIPSVDTTYWCSVHGLPESIEQQEKFLYKISPVIYSSSSPYVHHILAYLCTNFNDSHIGASQDCNADDVDVSITICRRGGILFTAWAVGGNDFVLPNGVGYPFGGKGDQYIVLETHYNNPSLASGVIDNSGLEFFYTTETPVHRAGQLTLGQHAAVSMMIPPQANQYVINAVCPETCTRQFFPEEGITIFADLFHTHLAGRGLILRHFRNTSSCRGGLEELAPIDVNERYDFNYQQTTILPNAVKVLPGDILYLECKYQTTNYQSMVLGGGSTLDEMCFSFFYYYPETKLHICAGVQLVSQEFTRQNFNETTEEALFRSIQGRDRSEIKNIFNSVTWNSKTIGLFQETVNSNDYVANCIDTTNATGSIKTATRLPEVKCPYVPPVNCPVMTTGSKARHHHFSTLLSFITFLLSIYQF